MGTGRLAGRSTVISVQIVVRRGQPDFEHIGSEFSSSSRLISINLRACAAFPALFLALPVGVKPDDA